MSTSPEKRIDLLCPDNGFELTSGQFSLLESPIVYLFCSDDDTPLYIGFSKIGLSRTLNPKHRAAKAKKECSKVLVYPFKKDQAEAAMALERLLIRLLKPKYNTAYNTAK